MYFWPHLPVWPFFLAGCVVLWRFNRPAALAFATYWLLFQYYKAVSPTQETYFLFISFLASAIYLATSRSVGVILATVALVYFLHISGFVGDVPKMISAEALVAFGMVLCGYMGPDRGILVAGGFVFGRNAGHWNFGHGWGGRFAQDNSAL